MGHHGFAVGHLLDVLGGDEADGVDVLEAGGDELFEVGDFGGGGDEVGEALPGVAWAFDEGDGIHWASWVKSTVDSSQFTVRAEEWLVLDGGKEGKTERRDTEGAEKENSKELAWLIGRFGGEE